MLKLGPVNELLKAASAFSPPNLTPVPGNDRVHRRAGYTIGRDQVARLMKMAGVRGVIRGCKPITTKPVKTPDVRTDLVQRNFRAPPRPTRT